MVATEPFRVPGREGGEERRGAALRPDDKRDDAQPARVQLRPASPPGDGLAVGVVGDLDHVRTVVFGAVRPGESQVERLAVGTKDPRQRRQGCVDLRVAILGGAHDRGVQPKRHVVHEHVAVQVGEIDPAFHGVAVRVQRAHHVVAVEPEVEREVVAGAGGDDHHRQPGLRRDRRDHRLRAVPARHAEHIDAARGHIADPLEPVLPRLEDHRLDPSPAALVHEFEVLCLAAARLQVHEEHAAGRGAHRRAGDVGRLERAHRGPKGVLRQSDGNHEQANA